MIILNYNQNSILFAEKIKFLFLFLDFWYFQSSMNCFFLYQMQRVNVLIYILEVKMKNVWPKNYELSFLLFCIMKIMITFF